MEETVIPSTADLVSLVSGLVPVLALVWAIYAFYGARKADRDDELRRERQKIYQEYWAAIRDIKRPHKTIADNGLLMMQAIGPNHERVALVAPDAVARASLKYLNAHVGDHNYTEDGPVPELGSLTPPISKAQFNAMVNASNPARDARRELLLEMRRDLLKGTKVDPSLTSIEELEK